MSDKKVLVVDDDEGVLDAVRMILEDSGYLVEIAFKGDETVSVVNRFRPQLIMLDVLMSGKDGREICKLLKESDETKKIPVIMISAHPSAGRSLAEFGADDFLAKPFSSAELLKKVRKYCK